MIMCGRSICTVLSMILLTALSGVCAADGSALQFDGTNDRVDVGAALVSENITMSAWVKAGTPWVNDTRVVVSNSYWGAAANRVGFHLMLQSNGTVASRFQTQADGVGVWSVTGTTNVTGAWHHLTYVKEGTKISIVVDGKEENSRNDMPASITGLAVNNIIRIGCNTSNARFFPGLIDEVRIWNYALTLAEIQEGMTHELRGTEKGLVGYWKFNEGQGTTAFDSAPIPHNGTLVNGPTWTTEGAPITSGPLPLSAFGPSPAGGATDVPRDSALSWKAGAYADQHDVYLGTTLADVNTAGRTAPKGVLAGQGQAETVFDPAGVFAYGQTYYWRVDEVNKAPDNTIFKGAVWSFTVEPYGYTVRPVKATASSSQANMGPEKTIDGSGMTGNLHGTLDTTMWLSGGVLPNWIQYEFDKVYQLNEMQVWNSNQLIETFLGFGARNVTVETSTDGTTWIPVANVPEFAKAPAAPGYAANTTVNLGPVDAKYVRLTVNTTWGGVAPQAGLAEVRFSYVPVQARAPQPATAAKDVAVDTSLNWRPGRQVASHQVYFGTDPAAVAAGTAPAQTVAEHGFDPGSLTFGTTYYWKVDEVNAVTCPGEVWSFTTQESAVVEDFESYTDKPGDEVFSIWADGMINSNGSIVGLYPDAIGGTFCETTIVHGGKQSMPFEYNNVKPPYYSEAERTFDTAQDWTVHGADTLTVDFRGNPAAFAEAAGTITMSGGGTDIWNTADQFRFACKPLTGDGTIVAKVESVGNTDPWAKAGVMIRESLDPGSRFAAVYATPGNGVRYQARALTAGSGTSDTSVATAEQMALKTPVWVKIERKGSSFSCFYSTDGVTWTTMSWNPQTINMTAATVYIGLAVTSHNATATTTASFSGVSTTGNATGAWQVQAIGVAQPANDAAPLYVVVQDSSGKSKTIMHPDPAATTVATWQAWQIPLSEISAGGVKLTAVKKLILGVGDRANPKPDGAGKLYIDDIGFGHPASAN
jgi:hypothetical protein